MLEIVEGKLVVEFNFKNGANMILFIKTNSPNSI